MFGNFQGRRKGVRGLRGSKFTIHIPKGTAKYDLVHSIFNVKVAFYFYRKPKNMKKNIKVSGDM